MGYADVIAREAETLPLEKQAEILDFIAFLKARQLARFSIICNSVPYSLASPTITPPSKNLPQSETTIFL